MYYELADAASSGTAAVWTWFTGSLQSFCRDQEQGGEEGGREMGNKKEAEIMRKNWKKI